MTVASLGFKIDSTQASSAAVDLEKLYAAAAKMETAAENLTTSAGALAGALKRVGDETKKVPPVARPFQNQDEHVRAFRAEIERLTVKYQPLANAQKNYAAAVSEINRAHQLGIINAQQMQKALDGERLAFERLKTSATTAGAAVKAANQNGVSGAQRAAGINAGYQFQDIAVTAAMGMNPLMIGLQQGTQLASVLASMERPVAGLAAAFGSIISPVTLVTVGLTAGVAALVQYFSTAESGSEKTSRLFEEQNETIRRAAELWGDAAPALKAYVDELDRADKIAQGREAGGILAGRELEGLSSNLDDIKVKAIEALRSLRGDPDNAVIVRDLVSAWGDLRERLDNGTASMADLNRVQRELATAVNTYGTPQVLQFSKAFDEVTAAIYRGVEAAQKARTEWIAALAGGTSVQDIVEGATFNDNGTIRRPSDFIPRVPGIPTSRPSDLAADPDVADSRILNSDGRFTAVPVPTEKPNFFELEKENEKVDEVTKAYLRAQEAKANFWLDVSFAERQAGRNAMDRQIATTLTRYGFDENLNSPEANAIRQQLQWQQAKDLARGFGDAFSAELLSGSHDIGKAFLKGFEAAISSEASKLWEKFFDGIGNIFADWLTGSKGGTGAGSANVIGSVAAKAIGLGGNAVNDNTAGGFSGLAKASVVPSTDIASYIAQAAIKRGIDPDIALRVAKSEGGLNSWNLQSNYVKNGVREPSFGPFQLYKGGGLGNVFQKKTGLDPALASSGPAGVDFALDHAAKNGWGAWYGAKNAGIGNFEGIGKASKAIEGLGDAATTTAKMTEGLGQTLASIPQALMANGGGGGILSGLTKYGMGLFSGSSQFASAWLKGGIGLYADGTSYAPGGLAIVGERGPELVNLPQGSKVFNTNKSQDMMAANGNDAKVQPPKYDIHIYGGSGDQHIRDLVQQGIAAAQGEQSYQMRRGGFGDMQRRYSNQKG